jgi:hypothetical protein
MSSNANYAATPKSALAQLSAANTNRDGTGTIVTVLTAGTSGTRIDDITITATGTTTAGVVRLFIHDGTTARLWREVLVSAITPSTTVSPFSATLTNLGLVLQTGFSLRASTNNAETFNICVTRAGDF